MKIIKLMNLLSEQMLQDPNLTDIMIAPLEGNELVLYDAEANTDRDWYYFDVTKG